jgi:LysR family hydrogen peroxide-inducible transcriptional activator
MTLPTLQQLRYAVAVADQQHFGRAAAQCFVSQPALSSQVRELEARLRVQLFERSQRGVLVTPAGAEVVERARRILRDVDELCEAAVGAGDSLAGPLRLGVIPTVAPYVLPAVLQAIAEAHPALELYLREDRTDALVAQLLVGELDLLLLALPLDRPGVTELALYDEPFRLAMPHDHPLAAQRRCSVADLAGERLVLLEDGHCLRDQALAVCASARAAGGAAAGAEVQGTSLPTVVQMVGAGLGVTLLPEMTVEREARPIRHVVVRDLSPAPTRTIGLAWRTSSSRGDSFHRLGELITDACGRNGGRGNGPRGSRTRGDRLAEGVPGRIRVGRSGRPDR